MDAERIVDLKDHDYMTSAGNDWIQFAQEIPMMIIIVVFIVTTQKIWALLSSRPHLRKNDLSLILKVVIQVLYLIASFMKNFIMIYN